jgi:two-component system NtrC family sensor kinase
MYVGFSQNDKDFPEEVYLHSRSEEDSSIITWYALSAEEQSIFLHALHTSSVRKCREKRARIFKTLPPVSLERIPRGVQAKSTIVERFFFTTQTGVQGIILLVGTGKGSVPLNQEDRDALRVCTELLSVAIENGDLFEKILHAKQEWERTVDAIRDVVMIIGPDSIIRRANRRLSELAGVPLEKMQGSRCHHLLYRRESPCPDCPAKETLHSMRESTSEVVSEDGQKIFQVWSYPILDLSARLDSLAVYEKDVTEYKEMQRQLLHSEKMAVMGRLASAVAHELNNPLSGVISFSQILLKEIDTASPLYADVKVLDHAALRCKKIVEDLLAFSRKPEVHTMEPVVIDEIIKRSLGLMEHRLRMKRIQVSVETHENLPTIQTNPDQLQQVLINFICNADDAMEPGGRLSIKVCRDEREGALVLSVQDTGSGIPPEDLKKIFEPFYTTKSAGKGTGLGLSICFRIIESLGGQIEVDSRVGQGSTFRVRLPITRKASFSEGI